MPPSQDRRNLDELLGDFGSVGTGDVRLAERLPYDVSRGYGGSASAARVEASRHEYAPRVRPDSQREILQSFPDGHAYSVRQAGAPQQVVRREYSMVPVEQYYGRVPLQGEEEVIYLDRPPLDSFR